MLPSPFIFLPCLMHPVRFSFFYYLFFLSEPISDAYGILHFVSIDFLILCTSRLILKILALSCFKFLIKHLHGIKYKRAMGKITITGFMMREEQENRICLSVKDNGVGMEEEELRRLQKEIVRPCKETESGFGLANVNERIRMNFGMEYGLTITSEKGEGTEVRVMIPAQNIEDFPDGGYTNETSV